MKILMLNYEFAPLGGGAGVATSYLLKEFGRYPDIELDLVTSSCDEARVETLSRNITVHYLDIGKKNRNLHFQSVLDLLAYSWKAYFYSKKLIIEKRYDLIHAIFGVPSGLVAMLLGRPYMVSLRGSDVPFHNPRFFALDHLLLGWLSPVIWKKARSVVANSETLIESAARLFPKKKIGLIYNGVDTRTYRPGAAAEGARAVDGLSAPLRLLYVGRLSEVKGVGYLIEAMRIVGDDIGSRSGSAGANDHSPLLTIVGGGPLKTKYEKMVKHMGLGNNVVFLDRVDREKIPEIYRGSDIFILPSVNEGMPMSLVEAMASGMAVITTDAPSVRKLVTDGRNGYVVKKRDSQALAGAVMKYVQGGRALARSHGAVSREASLAFSWAKTAEQYIGMYGRMINA